MGLYWAYEVQLHNTTIIHVIKNSWDLRDDIEVTSVYCSCKQPNFSPRIHKQFTNTVNSRSKGSNGLFWPPWAPLHIHA